MRRKHISAALLVALTLQAQAVPLQVFLAIKKIASGSGSWAMTWSAPLLDAGTAAAAASTPTSFTIVWGQNTGGPYPYSHTTADGTVLTYTITGLTSGTWYACVKATNAAGDSDCSYEDTKVIP